MVRTGLLIVLLLLVVFAALIAFGVVDVRQTRQAQLPEISAEGGQLPAFDVDTPVEVRTRNETVTVPDISIDGRDEGADEPEQR